VSNLIRIADAGDIHCSVETAEPVRAAFERIEPEADLILLAGDLTTYGEPEQASILAEICRGIAVPVIAVLGNHDWHANRRDEVVEVLAAAGMHVLDRSWMVCELRATEIGIVGAKGFVGGFPAFMLPDFGEPLLRQVYAETTAEVEALAAGLEAISECTLRIVLLHYSPTQTTLEGEPPAIWAFLGTDRMAPPIVEHHPDLVLHGHGHAGTFEGFVGPVPVFNVAVPVMGRDFWVFELDGARRRPIAVEGEEASPEAPRPGDVRA
jgi:Icc-related predicted phosphoesterase